MTSPYRIAPPCEPTLLDSVQERLSGFAGALDWLIPLVLPAVLLIGLAVARKLG